MVNEQEGVLNEGEKVARRTEEEKEIEKRSRNIVLYRVTELQTNNVEERKRDDLSFIRNRPYVERGIGCQY